MADGQQQHWLYEVPFLHKHCPPVLLQAGLAAGSSLAWCFLAGLVAVPAEVLSQVPPVLLVRLLHHLNPHPTPPATAEQANTGSLGPPIPQVTAIHSFPFKVLTLLLKCQVPAHICKLLLSEMAAC